MAELPFINILFGTSYGSLEWSLLPLFAYPATSPYIVFATLFPFNRPWNNTGP
jgi:hypothetical protein